MSEWQWGKREVLPEDRLRFFLNLACGIVPNFQLRGSDQDLGLAGVSFFVLTGVDN